MTAKPNELSDEQLSNIWKNDRLNRREDAEFLSNFLLARVENRRKRELDASYVLNIDASWGRGKTFFLNNFAEQLKQQGYIVAEVNAWRDDYSDDPFLSVMSAIDDAIKPLIKKDEKKKELWSSVKQHTASILVAGAKGAAKQFTKKFFGEDMLKILPMGNSDQSADESSASHSTEIFEGIGEGFETRANQYFEQIGDKLLDRFNNEKQAATNF
ncbi:MAG TPA: hypothetical protein ENK61_00500, partial [Devosia sp.]|nr:hypothetical protein [Devosia sp.]